MIVVAITILFAIAGGCGVALAMLATGSLTPFEDGPTPRKIHPLWAVFLMVALGVVLMIRHVPLNQLGLIALISVPLIAAWYADASTGLIPDWFTLAPLGLLAIYMVVTHNWLMGLAAIVVAVPFSITALMTKGIGMGWGDVKLATLAAAMLGLMPALATLAVACLTATVVSAIRDRCKTPIALGPYLAGTTLVALALVG